MVGILLGLPGQWAENELESSDHYTTKIGGTPDFPPLPVDLLKPELLNCASCGSKLSLVAQVYAPISSDIKERTIYIFGCLMPQCGTSEQSWRAFSVQKAIKEKEPDLPIADSKTHWLDDDDDDDNEGFDLESLAKALAEATTTLASSSKKPKNKPKLSPLKPEETKVADRVKLETGAVLPCFYIYTKEENVSKEQNRCSVNYSYNDKTEEVWEDEKYEQGKALYSDRTYLKFKKRLDANPEQCFRYSYGGKPLLANKDSKPLEKCERCESPMVFEMQLMPPLIYFLHEAVLDKEFKLLMDNWDWITLILYTCSKRCEKEKNGGDWVVSEECVRVEYEKPMKLDEYFFKK